jgi:hypothetical protein
MGTSAPYSGPTGKNPLIPPWAETPEDGASVGANSSSEQSENQNEAAPENIDPPQNVVNPSTLTPWNEVKTNFTNYARSSGFLSTRSARRAIRGFVRAQGGARNAATNARKGRSVAQNIGGIFSGIASQGSNFTYNGFNFRDCIGKKASELLETFVDLVVDHNDDLESTIARGAVVEAFQKLFDVLKVEEKGFEALQSVNSVNLKFVFQTYLSEYIFASMLQKVGQTLEKMTSKEAYQKEKWLKNFIITKVSLNLENVDLLTMDWKGEAGRSFTNTIFTQSYKLMETA